jgi:archaellum biogenesis ATPase FlaH
MIVAAMTNSDFLAEVLGPLAQDEYGWVCDFAASPEQGNWAGRSYRGTELQAQRIDKASGHNTYFCTAVLSGFIDRQWARQKTTFRRLAALVVDDVDPGDIGTFTWALQTSPGKWQVGIALDADDRDASNLELVDRVMGALSARGKLGGNDVSGNAACRYVRLPVGTNTKPRAAGAWQHQLAYWHPQVRWTLEDACRAVGIDLEALRQRVVVEAHDRPSGGASAAVDALASLTAPVDERSYHDPITRLAASLISGGMFAGAAVEHLYALMDTIKPAGPADEVRRWEARRAEIPRAVSSAAAKFTPEVRQAAPVTINLQRDEPPPPSDLEPLDWTVLEVNPPEPAQFLLEGWLPRRTTTLLSANGGVGKSNLSLQLATALSLGRPAFDLRTTPSRVLVISAEDETRTVHWRLSNIVKHYEASLTDLQDRLTVYDLADADCVLWRDGFATKRMQWLSDAIQRHQADIVIIDNASDVFAANENDRTEVRGFLRCLNMLAAGHDCAMLLLAHVDKASVRLGAGLDTDSTFSGSTAWNNSCRSRWAMVREQDRVLLRHEKCNLGPLQPELEIEFDPGRHVFAVYGSVPGLSAARAALRKSREVGILQCFARAETLGVRVAPTRSSGKHFAFAIFTGMPEMPDIDKGELEQMITQFVTMGWLRIQRRQDASRHYQEFTVLTDEGRRKLGVTNGN